MLLHTDKEQKSINRDSYIYKYSFNINKEFLNKATKVIFSLYTEEHDVIKYIERPFKPDTLNEGNNIIDLSSPLALPTGTYTLKVDYIKEDTNNEDDNRH